MTMRVHGRRFVGIALIPGLAWLLCSTGLSLSASADWGIYTVAAEGGMPKRLTEPTGGRFGSPCWSPDGKTIAFDMWDHGQSFSDARLAVVSSKGGKALPLGHGGMPSYSPDGSQIACQAFAPYRTVVLNTDGGGRETIVEEWGAPRWSPDGRSIVVALSTERIARYDLATARLEVLVGPTYRAMHGLSLSPDAKRFCFSSWENAMIVATAQDGGHYDLNRRLLRWTTRHSSWFPDSQRVVFSGAPGAAQQEFFRLYVCSVDDTAGPTTIPGIPNSWSCCDPCLSKDGRMIAFSARTPDDE